ncbi:hypothetical protein D3C80_1675990 [compost metagenome]
MDRVTPATGVVVLCLYSAAHECLHGVRPRLGLGAIGCGVEQAPLHYCGGVGIPGVAGIGGDVQSLQPAASGRALEEVAQAGLCDSCLGVAALPVGRACRS